VSLNFLVNHGGNSATSLAAIAGTTASGDIYDLISGPRSTYWRSTASSSLTNLLADGSDFSTASWAKEQATASATTITASASNNRHNVRQSDAAVSAGATYQFIVDVKYSNHQYVWIGEGGDANWHGGVLDFTAGTFTANAYVDVSSAELLSDGYYRVRVQWTRTNGTGTQELYIALQDTANSAAPAFWTATGTEAVLAKNAFFSVWTSGAIYPGYSFAADVACTHLVVARADWMVTQSGARVRAFQKSSGGSWSAISGADYPHLRAGDLIGPRSQDLVLDISGATNYRGFAVHFDSFLAGNAEAMMISKMYASVGFSFAMPPVFAQPWVDIPESDRWFRPQQTLYEYETEKQFKLGFPATRAEMTSFKALPMLLKWPLFLYDTAGDVFPWKLEHVVIEGWIETVIEDDRHFVEITLRRLKHYP